MSDDAKPLDPAQLLRPKTPEPSFRISIRRHHSKEVWAQAKRDYLLGETASAVAARYAMTVDAIRKRSSRQRWCKRASRAAPPEPLVPFPDPGEVYIGEDGDIVSAWDAIAHPAQRPPTEHWSTWLFQGGRGAGKTRAGAEWLAARAEGAPGGLFALVGPTQHDVREVMIDGPSGLRNLPGRERPNYERSRRRLVWPNGAVAYAFSAEEPDRLRGPQFEAAWADEFCMWPKPIAALRRLRAEPSCALTQAPTVSNAAHLAPSFLDGLTVLYGGTRLAAQELEGLLVEGDGALFRAEDLQSARGARPAAFDRVVVAVDPPAGAAGAACGIVVAARRGANAYVLADCSAHGLSPLGWASCAAEAARTHGAAEIVAEANQGGDMVRATLASAGAACPVRLVHASRGKRARAEPVAALYEQGRIVHCDAFPALEEELMALGAAESEGLLDRADALVWAVTALMLHTPDQPRISRL